MPVMKLGCCRDLSDRSEIPPDVSVDEDGLKRKDRQIDVHRFVRKTKQYHWSQTDRACGDDVHDVKSRPRYPVHDPHAVMNTMKSPEERDAMKRTVDPVLREVGHGHYEDDL